MDIQAILIAMAKGAVVGGLIGYLTNELAVRMLFRPRKPWKLFGLHVPMTPGLVESNRERLADAIGRSVAHDLLTIDVLVAEIREAGLHEPVAAWLDEEREVLLRDGRTLRLALGDIDETLPTKLREALVVQFLRALQDTTESGLLDGLISELMDSIAAVKPSAFIDDAQVSDLLGGAGTMLREFLAGESGEQALASVVTSDRLDAVAAKFENTAHGYVAGRAPAVVSAMQDGLAEYLQSSQFSEQARARLVPRLHRAVIDKFPMAKLLLSERAVADMLRDNWASISNELEALAASPEVESFMAKQVDVAANNFVAAAGDAIRDEETASAIRSEIRNAADAPAAGNALAGALSGVLRGLLDKPVGELLSGGKMLALRNMISEKLRTLMQSSRFEDVASKAIHGAVDRFILGQTISDLAALLRGEAWEAVRVGLAEKIERRALEKLPSVIESRVDIAEVIRRRIVAFDSEQVETTLRRVSGNELKGIVRLGGIIGIVVGATAAVLDLLIGINN